MSGVDIEAIEAAAKRVAADLHKELAEDTPRGTLLAADSAFPGAIVAADTRQRLLRLASLDVLRAIFAEHDNVDLGLLEPHLPLLIAAIEREAQEPPERPILVGLSGGVEDDGAFHVFAVGVCRGDDANVWRRVHGTLTSIIKAAGLEPPDDLVCINAEILFDTGVPTEVRCLGCHSPERRPEAPGSVFMKAWASPVTPKFIRERKVPESDANRPMLVSNVDVSDGRLSFLFCWNLRDNYDRARELLVPTAPASTNAIVDVQVGTVESAKVVAGLYEAHRPPANSVTPTPEDMLDVLLMRLEEPQFVPESAMSTLRSWASGMQAAVTADDKTPLRNARALKKASSGATAESVVCFGDLNGLKRLNDANGHAAGDAAIRAIGDALGRIAVICGGEAFRVSGDEFLMVAPGHRIDMLHQHLKHMQKLPFQHDGKRLFASASFGLAWVRDHVNFDAAVRAADLASQYAKQEKKNEVVEWSAELRLEYQDVRFRCESCGTQTHCSIPRRRFSAQSTHVCPTCHEPVKDESLSSL